MKIEIGQLAPDFTLYNTDKVQVTLSAQKGKNVLLLFFPFAFTGTCTKELCGTRDDIAYYNAIRADVFGISVDSPHALRKFKEVYNLNFPLLSDFNKTVSADYGCLYEEFSLGLKGVSKRSAFVIDKEGIIRYAEILENASELPNFDSIKKVLSDLN